MRTQLYSKASVGYNSVDDLSGTAIEIANPLTRAAKRRIRLSIRLGHEAAASTEGFCLAMKPQFVSR